MAIWAIGDLHLSFGVPNKKMDVFGEAWHGHDEKIRKNWLHLVAPDDLVLLPGDISWATKTEDAMEDLLWIDKLPGTKVMIRGNHDYWWSTKKKLKELLPPSIYAIQNDSFRFENVEIGGARLWDSDFTFNDYIVYKENVREKKNVLLDRGADQQENQRIYDRELIRLELSLQSFQDPNTIKIAMTHYPPVDAKMNPSKVSELLEKYGVSICVFGHLHSVKEGSLPFGEKRAVRYLFTSCDYLEFCPIKVL